MMRIDPDKPGLIEILNGAYGSAVSWALRCYLTLLATGIVVGAIEIVKGH